MAPLGPLVLASGRTEGRSEGPAVGHLRLPRDDRPVQRQDRRDERRMWEAALADEDTRRIGRSPASRRFLERCWPSRGPACLKFGALTLLGIDSRSISPYIAIRREGPRLRKQDIFAGSPQIKSARNGYLTFVRIFCFEPLEGEFDTVKPEN